MKTRWHVVLASLFLLAASVVAAQEITLPAKVQGPRGKFLEVTATTKGDVVRWLALDPGLNLFPIHLLKDSRTAVVTSDQAGTYRLVAWTAIGGVPTLAVECLVEIDGGKPIPPTPPGPIPPTPPGPTPPDDKAAALFVLVIEETFDAAATRGQWFTSPEMAELKTAGVKIRVVDKDTRGPKGEVPSDLRAYLEFARDKPLPYLFVVDDQAKVRMHRTIATHDSPLIIKNDILRAGKWR